MRSFVTADRGQVQLLPTTVEELLPEDHLARFVVEVVGQLDLSSVVRKYTVHARGSAPYHPALMTALLFYGYASGVFSSRKLERACRFDLAFRYIAGGHVPDHDTISEFRRVNLAELAGLFVQILMLAHAMGFLKVGSVALDGTKIKANASKHAAVSYKRAGELELRLTKEVEELMKMAAEADNVPVAEGLDIPAEIARREDRIEKLRHARAALEKRQEIAEQKEYLEKLDEHAAGAKEACDKPAAEPPSSDATAQPPAPPEPPAGGPPPDMAQYNFTDPDSRIMPDKGAFSQAYNAQAAVDTGSMLIVEHHLSQNANDKKEFVPALDILNDICVEVFGAPPPAIIADTGYFSAANVAACPPCTEAYIAPGRTKHNRSLENILARPATGEAPANATPAEKMRHKLDTEKGRANYGLRKTTVEPVFGIAKGALGFRQFLLRGAEKARHEWGLVCLAVNLKRLHSLRQAS